MRRKPIEIHGEATFKATGNIEYTIQVKKDDVSVEESLFVECTEMFTKTMVLDVPCKDSDEDGYTSDTCGGDDCNDTDPKIHPGAEEKCDRKDNDCDGEIDEGGVCKKDDVKIWIAEDRTYRNGEVVLIRFGVVSTAKTAKITVTNHCAQGVSKVIIPGEEYLTGNMYTEPYEIKCPSGESKLEIEAVVVIGEEIKTLKDECILKISICADNDGDGYDICHNDCDDNDPSIHPGAEEKCDGIDNNCDGEIDEGCPLISLPILKGIVLLFLISSIILLIRFIKNRYFPPPGPIPNPYIVGIPLRTKDMFFGRKDIFDKIKTKLSAKTRDIAILLHGERRTGKTSVLYQIKNGELGEEFIPVYIDIHEMALCNDKELLTKVTDKIMDSLVKSPVIFRSDDYSEINRIRKEYETRRNPYETFSSFLDKVSHVLEEKYLIVMFDEYDDLDDKIASNHLSPQLITYMRSLLPSREKFTFIFTGSKKLEELKDKRWNVMFNVAYSMKISFLEKKDALDLIKTPDRVRYDGKAIDKLLRLTACHPYFLQLFLQKLIDNLNVVGKYEVRERHINDIRQYFVDNPQSHMGDIWDNSTPEEKMVLSALSEIIESEDQYVSIGGLEEKLKETGALLNRNAIKRACIRLKKRDILEFKEAGAACNFRVDFLRYWIRKAHPLWITIEEGE